MENKVLREIAAAYGTPTYVYDLELLQKQVREIQNILGPNVTFCYAMKANPFLIGPMNVYADKYEVCSPGEYEICMEQGIAPEKIVVSGVNKTRASMERILFLSGGKGVYTLESPLHYAILSELCKERKLRIPVLLRLSSGNQFGMDKETLERVLREVLADEWLQYAGIHHYSGTQKKGKKITKELAELSEYGSYLQETYGVKPETLEYGPSLLTAYFTSDQVPEREEQLHELAEQLAKVTAFSKITIEMGRFPVSACGTYLTSVADVKQSDGTNYAILDGGIHQLNYYGQIMGMKCPRLAVVTSVETDTAEYQLCGSLCTANDILVKGVSLPKLTPGDVLAFSGCGAYSVTEGMALFLSRELPEVILYDGQEGARSVRSRQSVHTWNSAGKSI